MRELEIDKTEIRNAGIHTHFATAFDCTLISFGLTKTIVHFLSTQFCPLVSLLSSLFCQ